MESAIINFPYDLRGRAAANFVQQIEAYFQSPVYCEKENRRINAHSLLGILSLGIKKNEKVCFLVPEEKDIDTLFKIIRLWEDV